MMTIAVSHSDETHWETQVDSGQAPVLSHQQCRLVVTSGRDTGTQSVLHGRKIRVGARSRADLVLSDPRVSGLHFEVALGAAGCVLRDLGSRNGTYVGSLRVHEATITGGTLIRVGDTELRFEVLGETVETPLSVAHRFGRLVGGSPLMRELFARLERICQVDTTVLIRGETGTGKDLAAEALHTQSPRRGGPFAILDCGAISANLMESELFGHEKGAFTGATRTHPGVFERGHRGTVFLDEIGEVPLDLQPKLLRILENRRVRRMGGTQDIALDVRVVAATNRDLAMEVERGRFREDLYYRLAVLDVVMPPLRERKEDIELLVRHLLSSIPGAHYHELQGDNLALLMRYDWPGNVRELRNVMERAAVLEDSGLAGTTTQPPVRADDDSTVDLSVPFKTAKKAVVDEFERTYVEALLDAHNGNISACARASGVDRMVIHKIAERHGLRKPR